MVQQTRKDSDSRIEASGELTPQPIVAEASRIFGGKGKPRTLLGRNFASEVLEFVSGLLLLRVSA